MRSMLPILFFILAAPLAAEQRIVSMLPSNTEILYALKADRIVGVSSYCDYPPETKKAEKVGDYFNPNIEKIYALKPDMVFAGDWANSQLSRRLKQLNINVVTVPEEKSVDDIYRTIRLLGDKTGKTQEADRLIKDIKAAIKPYTGTNPKPKVYIEIDPPHWTTGRNSYISDLVEKAGGQNIFADNDTPYFNASWETVVAKNPDIILVLAYKSADIRTLPGADKIAAVKNNRVIVLKNRDIYLRPSPRVVTAFGELQNILKK